MGGKGRAGEERGGEGEERRGGEGKGVRFFFLADLTLCAFQRYISIDYIDIAGCSSSKGLQSIHKYENGDFQPLCAKISYKW